MPIDSGLMALVLLGDEARELAEQLRKEAHLTDEERTRVVALRERHHSEMEALRRRQGAELDDLRSEAEARKAAGNEHRISRLREIRVEIDRILPGRATTRARLEALCSTLREVEHALRNDTE